MSTFGPWAAQLLRPDALTLLEDIASDSRIDGDLRADLIHRFGAKSAVFAPLVAGGQWIGNISAFYQEPSTFPEVEIRRLTALSGQAAAVVQGVRQLQEIQARARREALIREIGTKVSSSMDLKTVLQTTVRELSQALGASQAIINIRTQPEEPATNSKEGESIAPHTTT
jgi:GAF domain-containing protein